MDWFDWDFESPKDKVGPVIEDIEDRLMGAVYGMVDEATQGAAKMVYEEFQKECADVSNWELLPSQEYPLVRGRLLYETVYIPLGKIIDGVVHDIILDPDDGSLRGVLAEQLEALAAKIRG